MSSRADLVLSAALESICLASARVFQQEEHTAEEEGVVEEEEELLVTLHLDVLNACCASKLIAAACAAPKFNAKFSKHNNAIHPRPAPSPLQPPQHQLLFGESCLQLRLISRLGAGARVHLAIRNAVAFFYLFSCLFLFLGHVEYARHMPHY